MTDHIRFAVIYDYGPEDEPIESHYEQFADPAEAWAVFRSAFPPEDKAHTVRNARLVAILGDIDTFKPVFVNHYECAQCGTSWRGQWSCACDDDCPKCRTTTSPHESVDTSDIPEATKAFFENAKLILPSGEGDQDATMARSYIEAAQADSRVREGELEVDDNATVNPGDDPGAYVQAWLWVCESDLED